MQVMQEQLPANPSPARGEGLIPRVPSLLEGEGQDEG